jgi:[acyl-carrier-protein] S-malonyltransferase
MDPAADAMEKALAPVDFKDPSLPIIANITAQKETEGAAFRSLLVKQVTGQVRWRETMDLMAQEGVEVVFELGVGKVLSGLFKRAIEGVQTHAVHTPHDIEAALLILKV